ncbi:uncharacterized protein A4U43_C08F21830 [Asparagus officinalis]|nr:uncharacterized protein A4U43_C08F21830 [Asparagus officinalis]
MSQRSIQILTVSRVTLPPLPQIPSPIKLSFFDSIWIGIPPIQRLMLYSNPNVTRSSQSLAELLKSSLSATLVDYLPLAGTLTHVPSTGDVEIDFSDLNVSFYEAEADFDIRRLRASEIHDVGSFKKLVPEIDVSVLPFPIFAVQVSRIASRDI